MTLPSRRGGDLRDGINPHRQHRGHSLLVFEIESMADGDASLFHRRRSQRGKSDDVARSVDMWHRSTIILVDGYVSMLVDGQTRPLQTQPVHRGAAPGSKQH